jgi:hypothetical protein
LALPFLEPILSLLNYKLPILNKSNLEHLCLEISRQLALDPSEDGPDQLSILHKVVDVLVQ